MLQIYFQIILLSRDWFYHEKILHLCGQICMLNDMNKIENAATWSKERFDAELEKGYDDMLKGRTRPAAMVVSDVNKKYKKIDPLV